MCLITHYLGYAASEVWRTNDGLIHYNDVIMGAMASQITSLTIVYSTVYSDADQRKHQSSASLAFVRGIHRGPVNSPNKWPVTRKMFPFDDVIMYCMSLGLNVFNTWEKFLLRVAFCQQYVYNKFCNSKGNLHLAGIISVCTQPMRDDVTL